MKISTTYSIFIALLIVNSFLCMTCSEKLVIDTDGGADDAASILLALSAWKNKDSNFEVIAITCVNGNTALETVEQNVLKSITIANASDIQVYRGASRPLVEEAGTDFYFGADGLGDFIFKDKISASVNETIYSSVALVELAKLYPGQLNVLCLGPLTNIAIAAALDPNFMKNVKRFYIMGGSISGIGNKSPGVEFNFAADPESNFIVLNYDRDYRKQEPSLLYPWETVLNAKIEKSWRMYKLGFINSHIMRFLNKAESKSLKAISQYWTSADLQATAVMIWPHLSKTSIVTNITPVIDGAGRGSILVDYTKMSGKPENVEIVLQLDGIEFKKKLIWHFS